MLQWMGGSRRKLKTTKRSIHHRQRQYFAQRKRHHTEESQEDDITIKRAEEHKHAKSLDITSLMDICVAANRLGQQKTAPVSCDGNETLQYKKKCSIKNENGNGDGKIGPDGDFQKENNPLKVDAETQWTPQLDIQAANSIGHVNGYKQIGLQQLQDVNEVKEYGNGYCDKRNDSPKKLSIIDCMSDSGNIISPTSPVEIYAAFAIEGVGEIKNQTPVNVTKTNQNISIYTRNGLVSPNPKKKVLKTFSPPWNSEDFNFWQDSKENSLNEEIISPPICMKAFSPMEEILLDEQNGIEQTEICTCNSDLDYLTAKETYNDYFNTLPSMEEADQHYKDLSSQVSSPFMKWSWSQQQNSNQSNINSNKSRTNIFCGEWNDHKEYFDAYFDDGCTRLNGIPLCKDVNLKANVFNSDKNVAQKNILSVATENTSIDGAYDNVSMIRNSTSNYSLGALPLDYFIPSTSNLFSMMDSEDRKENNISDSLSDESCASSQQNVSLSKDNPDIESFQRRITLQNTGDFTFCRTNSNQDNRIVQLNGLELFENHKSRVHSSSSVTDHYKQEESNFIQKKFGNAEYYPENGLQNLYDRPAEFKFGGCRRSPSIGNFDVNSHSEVAANSASPERSEYNLFMKLEPLTCMRESSACSSPLIQMNVIDNLVGKTALKNSGIKDDDDSCCKIKEHEIHSSEETSFRPQTLRTDIQLREPKGDNDDGCHPEVQENETEHNHSNEKSNTNKETQPLSKEENLDKLHLRETENKRDSTADDVYKSRATKKLGMTREDGLCKGSKTDAVDAKGELEYQGMLESYVLQLICMNKALQETVHTTFGA